MQAVVMAGGRGTRLAPYTASLPKPLLPLGDGMPVLELLLCQLKAAGVTEVFLAVNHMHRLLRAYFGDGATLGLRLHYSIESKPLGTAGPLASLLDRLDERFFLTNGDLLTTVDFAGLDAAHCAQKAAATIAGHWRNAQLEFGVLLTDDAMWMTDYIEKPLQRHLVSMGCYMIDRAQVAPYLRNDTHLDMPNLMQAMVRDARAVHCHAPDCIWLDIGRPEDYAKARELFARDSAQFLRRCSDHGTVARLSRDLERLLREAPDADERADRQP